MRTLFTLLAHSPPTASYDQALQRLFLSSGIRVSLKRHGSFCHGQHTHANARGCPARSYPLHRRDSCDDPVSCGVLTTSRFFSLISIFATSPRQPRPSCQSTSPHKRCELFGDTTGGFELTTYSRSVQQSRLPLGHLLDWLPDTGHGPFPVSTTTLTASAWCLHLRNAAPLFPIPSLFPSPGPLSSGQKKAPSYLEWPPGLHAHRCATLT